MLLLLAFFEKLNSSCICVAGPWLTKFFWEMLWSGKGLAIGTPLCECIKHQQRVQFETVEMVVVLLFVVCVCICICVRMFWGWPHRSQRKAMGPLERKVKAVVTYPL